MDSPVDANGDEIKDGRSTARHIHCDVEIANDRRKTPFDVHLMEEIEISGTEINK